MVNIVGLKLVDLNNDTFLDILATGYDNDKLTWFANDGNGSFGSEQLIYNGNNGLNGLLTGMIDAGNTTDIAFTSYADGSVFWMSNNGTGVFSGPNTIDNTLDFPGSIHMKDIDIDGDLDALVSTGAADGADVVEIFRNDLIPDGSVAWAKDATSVTTDKNFIFNATFEDLDGDSNLDILVTELNDTPGGGNFYWIEEDGVGGYNETAFTTSIENPSVAQHHDLDDDGDKDIILCSGAVADVTDIVWFLNDGSGNYGPEVVIDNTQNQVYVFTVNDFDNDNDLDIVNTAFNEDELNWFENEKYSLGLNDFKENSISVYPNPTSNYLHFNGINKPKTVDLYDMLEKSVITSEINGTNLVNISQLNSGIYFLKIEGYSDTFKVIKR